MSNNLKEEIREQAVQFAKDFEIPYDKIQVKEKQVNFKQEASHSGGWVEGKDSTVVPIWYISRFYALINQKEKEARLDEYAWYKREYPTAPYMPDFIIEDRIKQLKEELKEEVA